MNYNINIHFITLPWILLILYIWIQEVTIWSSRILVPSIRKQYRTNSNSRIMMRGNMNRIINTSHYFLIKSFFIFFLNFLNVNTCAKYIHSQNFSQYKPYRLNTIQLISYDIFCWIKPLNLTCLYKQVFFDYYIFHYAFRCLQFFSPFYNHTPLTTNDDNNKK